MGITLNLENIHTKKIFKRGAARDILLFLEKNRYDSFSIREVHRRLEGRHSLYSIQKTIEELEKTGLIASKANGRKKCVAINPERIHLPSDPFTQIPQAQFRKAIRDIVFEIRAEIKGISGIVLFGSFSRGDADRMSDIDLLVIVKSLDSTEKTIADIEGSVSNGKLIGERFRLNTIIESICGIGVLFKKNPAILRALQEGIILYQDKGFRDFAGVIRK